jgi:hypothetical protein
MNRPIRVASQSGVRTAQNHTVEVITSTATSETATRSMLLYERTALLIDAGKDAL